jgi:hypothetical protein
MATARKPASYLDLVIRELEAVAKGKGLPFFVDDRRATREFGVPVIRGRSVAGESLSSTRVIADYEVRQGVIEMDIKIPGFSWRDESFKWEPGDDGELADCLKCWGDTASGKRGNDDDDDDDDDASPASPDI